MYAGFNLDKSDSLLDPRSGWRAEGRVIPTYAFGGVSDNPYARAVTQGRAYLPLDDSGRLVLAGRLRAGVLFGAQANAVPGDDRFYAGGGGSVRGYAYQAIGPFDGNNVPQGGRSLVDSSLEARWRYNDKIGLVGFFDGGNVSNSLYPKFDNLNIGVGAGIRYMTPAGPIRFDIATPLNPSDRDDLFQVYISIGQAF
jgi:translocation and assembly module TamA